MEQHECMNSDQEANLIVISERKNGGNKRDRSSETAETATDHRRGPERALVWSIALEQRQDGPQL